MNLSKAVEGFIFERTAGGLSPSTIALDRYALKNLQAYLGDVEIASIQADDLKRFMVHLRTAYIPKRFNGSTAPLGPSALDNHWKSIRVFFTWCAQLFDIPRPDLTLARPKFKDPEIHAFSEDEIKRMISASEKSAEAATARRKAFKMTKPQGLRDKAILLTLLDTGIRLGELCRLQVQDVNLETGEIAVLPFGSGQKTKPRMVYIGKTTRRAIWLHLAKSGREKTDPLFGMSHVAVRLMLRRVGRAANVSDCFPHRFRHTMAIFYLRNSGDIFTLQRLLGHSTLDMVRHYLDLVDADSANAHKSASPVDRLRL
jgi:integrase/recombinase XerD